jgi:hypothetical protein
MWLAAIWIHPKVTNILLPIFVRVQDDGLSGIIPLIFHRRDSSSRFKVGRDDNGMATCRCRAFLSK